MPAPSHPSPNARRSREGGRSFESIDADRILNRLPTMNSTTEPFPALGMNRTRTEGAAGSPEDELATDGGRKTVREWAIWFNQKTMNMAAGYDDDFFRTGEASEFPIVPGEEERNENLEENRRTWGVRTPSLRPTRSRADSFTSVNSDIELEQGGPLSPPPIARRYTNGHSPPLRPLRRGHSSTLPVQPRPTYISNTSSAGASSSNHQHRASDSPTPGFPRRRDTLEVPPETFTRHHRSSDSSMLGRPRRRDTLEAPPEMSGRHSPLRTNASVTSDASSSLSPGQSAGSLANRNPDAADSGAINQSVFDESN